MDFAIDNGAGASPPAGQHYVLHKDGEEGVLVVSRATGQITTPLNERPDWSEGLATALIQSRAHWWQARTAPEIAAKHLDETVANADDFGFIGLDGDGIEIEIAASDEWRMEKMRELNAISDADLTSAAGLELDLHGDTSAERITALEDETSGRANMGKVATGN